MSRLIAISQKVVRVVGDIVGWFVRHPIQGFLLAIGLLLVVELTGIANVVMERVELWHFGLRQQTVQESRTHSRITVVGLDDYSLSHPAIKQLFGRYPFQRGIYGTVVDFFARAHAESIFFDFGFSGGKDLDHPESDAYFVNRINTATQLPIFSALVANTQQASVRSNQREALLTSVLDWQAVAYDTLAPMLVLPVNTVQLPFASLAQSRMRFVFTNDAYHDVQGLVRFGGLFTRIQNQHNKRPTVYPTVPLVLALQRQQKARLQNNEPLQLPQLTYHQQVNRTPLTWRWSEKDASQPTKARNSVMLNRRHLPIIRWYGDVRGGYTMGGVYQVAEQFGIKDPAQLLGPVGQQLAGPWLRQRVNAAQWTYRESQVYPKFSLWDVVYSQLTHQCQPTISQHTHYEGQLCQQFQQLVEKEHVTGKLLPIDQFTNQTILVGTNYMNAPGDVHKTIYSGSNYPGVYIVANLLDNLLHNDFVRPAPSWFVLAATLILASLIGMTSYTRPVLYSTLFTVFLLAAYTMGTFWAYQHSNWWLPWAWPVTVGIVVFVVSFGVRYWITETRKQQLRYAFRKYVSRNVMQTIEANPNAITLGGQRRTLTFMFTDIRGFTSYSEVHPPEEVQSVLTRYFQAMHHIILRDHGGVINKLIGDAIMAYWGFPLEKADDPVKAVQAALAMRETMTAWNADPNNPPLRIGVGIHTGEAVIGNVGSDEFMDFTVIGDAVNLTSRLEGKTKELLEEQPCGILLSEATYEAVKDDIPCRSLGEITVKGKQTAITVYEPV